jgi:hypothetical protein
VQVGVADAAVENVDLHVAVGRVAAEIEVRASADVALAAE